MHEAGTETAPAEGAVDHDILQVSDRAGLVDAHRDETQYMIVTLVLNNDETMFSPKRQFQMLRVRRMTGVQPTRKPLLAATDADFFPSVLHGHLPNMVAMKVAVQRQTIRYIGIDAVVENQLRRVESGAVHCE